MSTIIILLHRTILFLWAFKDIVCFASALLVHPNAYAFRYRTSHQHAKNDYQSFSLRALPSQGSTPFYNKNTDTPKGMPVFLVPMAGVEPARCCHRRILSPLRLPIPSHRLNGYDYTTQTLKNQYFFSKN